MEEIVPLAVTARLDQLVLHASVEARWLMSE
jgi:hypothetical protein